MEITLKNDKEYSKYSICSRCGCLLKDDTYIFTISSNNNGVDVIKQICGNCKRDIMNAYNYNLKLS